MRRFHRNDSVQKVHDYLTVYFADNDDSVTNFAVSTHFPKVSPSLSRQLFTSLSSLSSLSLGCT